MKPFTELDAARLLKVVGLFDSPVDTEATAAFVAARSVARRCDVSLVAALAAVLGRPATSASVSRRRNWSPEPVPATASWMLKVMLCRDAPQLFNAATREFLSNMAVMRRAPSPAQLQWLDDLHARAIHHFQRENAA